MGETIVNRRRERCGVERYTSLGGFVVRYCGHVCRSRFGGDGKIEGGSVQYIYSHPTFDLQHARAYWARAED